MNEQIAPLTLENPDHAKRVARAMIDRERRLAIEFPANAKLLAMRTEDIVGSLVEFNGHILKITSWCDAWDSDKGLQRLFTAHELSVAELAAREER